MSESEKGDIVVCGAGLVGSLVGYVLQKRGYNVTIYERYGDIRQIPSLGRSINLVLTGRGLRAINAIGGGLREEVLALGVPVTGRVLHQTDSSTQYQPYGKDDSECNYSISRFELNKFLINKATEAGAKIYFGHALDENLTSFADDEHINGGGDVGSTLAFTVRDDSGVESRVIVACMCPVVACDGAGSRARYAMRKDGLTEFTETMLGDSSSTHGYKEMLFPKGTGLVQHGLHIWPRRTHMLMALANLDGSMTGTLYMDTKGEESFESISTPELAREFFQKHYPDAIELVGGLERATTQMLENPSGILGTVRTNQWNHRGRVLLIGDAAHAIVPFYGQGMNSGFEDVYDMLHVLSDMDCRGGVAHPPVSQEAFSSAAATAIPAMSSADAANWAAAFDKIFRDRKPNGDAIADLALINFEEMRDKVADRCFLLQKRVENLVENQFESKFRSMYAMVVYGGGGNITYANALRLGRVQETLLRDLIDDLVPELYALSEEEWSGRLDELAGRVSMARAEELIDSRLVPLQAELGIDLSTISH